MPYSWLFLLGLLLFVGGGALGGPEVTLARLLWLLSLLAFAASMLTALLLRVWVAAIGALLMLIVVGGLTFNLI